jgi:arsenate reductase-like glutaredoxin family protein
VAVARKVIANKIKLGPAEALELARETDQILVARGQKLTRLRPRDDRTGDDELLALLLGPSGTLRAPAVRVGRTLVIGFHPDAYREVFGTR